MSSITIDPTAISRVRAALKSSDFQKNNKISVMMQHIVDGAKTVEDCFDKGWPEWFVMLSNFLFDADSDAQNEQAARENFALRIAEYASEPVDYDRAHDLFLIRRLETSDHSSLKTLGALDGDYTLQMKAISSALDALKRREKGEVVSMRPVIHDLHVAAKTENLAAHHATLAANRTPAGCAESTARAAALTAPNAADRNIYPGPYVSKAAIGIARSDLLAALGMASGTLHSIRDDDGTLKAAE